MLSVQFSSVFSETRILFLQVASWVFENEVSSCTEWRTGVSNTSPEIQQKCDFVMWSKCSSSVADCFNLTAVYSRWVTKQILTVDDLVHGTIAVHIYICLPACCIVYGGLLVYLFPTRVFSEAVFQHCAVSVEREFKQLLSVYMFALCIHVHVFVWMCVFVWGLKQG